MWQVFSEDILKLVLSMIIGSLVGLEREFSSKAAGFRTIILISMGSTLFTIVSVKLGGVANGDRIAANIITGIGFIGAGVVFKDGFSVTGLTTAASIWVTAALGMTIGSGDYLTGAGGLVLVLIVLRLFEYLQNVIDNLHQRRTYKVVLTKDTIGHYADIEQTLQQMKLRHIKLREYKSSEDRIAFYDVYGSRQQLNAFNDFLLLLPTVKAFEC